MGEITVSLGAGRCRHCGARLTNKTTICYACKDKYRDLERKIRVNVSKKREKNNPE